ncbi:MAG: energy transducer TonB [Chitinophagaceae bacterium]
MNFNTLSIGFRKVLPVFTLSLLILACNSDDSGNKSTSGDNGMNTDTTSMGPDGAPLNNTTVVTGPADSSSRNRRKGRISASLAAEDLSSKITMDKMGYYNRTEVSPVFRGGQVGLEDYINANLEYPQEAIDNDIEGTVRVQFAVDEKGKVSNVSIIGDKLGYGLEEEAVKVVSLMPAWTAGTVKGKGVKTWRTLPITYKLES